MNNPFTVLRLLRAAADDYAKDGRATRSGLVMLLHRSADEIERLTTDNQRLADVLDAIATFEREQNEWDAVERFISVQAWAANALGRDVPEGEYPLKLYSEARS